MKRILQYTIASAVGFIAVVIVVCVKAVWDCLTVRTVMQVFSDAYFVVGVVLAGVGLLIVLSNGGAFDMLSYAFIKLIDLFRKGAKNPKYHDFYDYVEARREKPRGSVAFLLVVGAEFIVIACIFLILYYNL